MRFLSVIATIVGLAVWAGLAAAQPVTVRMWMHEHPPRIAIDKAIIAEFEKANSDIKIQYEVIPAADYSTKLLTAFAAGSGPDLFNNTSTLVTQYFAARILAPIDYAAMGYADEAALLAKFQGGFDGIRFQGKLYGVPTEVSNWACFANNALWKEAGLDPAKDWPKTWEGAARRRREAHQTRPERRADAPRLRLRLGGSRHLLVHPQHHDPPTRRQHDRRGRLQGRTRQRAIAPRLPVHPGLGGEVPPRRPAIHRHAGPTSSPASWRPNAASASGASRRCRMPRSTGTVMPAPRWADAVADNGLDIYAYYMMVNARSTPAVQKAAWKLARFYTDHAAELFAGAGLFVPRSEVTESAAYRDNSAAPFFLAELKKAKFSPRVVGYNQVLDAILRGRDRLVQGEKIDDVLPVMNEEVNAVMNRERATCRHAGEVMQVDAGAARGDGAECNFTTNGGAWSSSCPSWRSSPRSTCSRRCSASG